MLTNKIERQYKPSIEPLQPRKIVQTQSFFERHDELAGTSNLTYQNPKQHKQSQASKVDLVDPVSIEMNSSTDVANGKKMSSDVLELRQAFKRQDHEIQANPRAHVASEGRVTDAFSNAEFRVSSDRQREGDAGEVSAEIFSEGRVSEETLDKARLIRAAANGPRDPSDQDKQIALKAFQVSAEGRTGQPSTISSEEQDDVGKVVLEEEQPGAISESEEDNSFFNQIGLPSSEEEQEAKEKEQQSEKSESQEQEPFTPPIFDKDRKSAADLFQEIYGSTDGDVVESLVGLDSNPDEESPLAQALDLTA